MIYYSVIFTDQQTGQWYLCTGCLLHTQKIARQSMDPALIPPGIFLQGSSLKQFQLLPHSKPGLFSPGFLQPPCSATRRDRTTAVIVLGCALSYSEALAVLSSLIHLHVNMIILNELQTRFNCKNISSF